MKKVFRIVLAFVFILAFATSCGSTEGKKKPEATEGKAITEAVTQDSSTEDKSYDFCHILDVWKAGDGNREMATALEESEAERHHPTHEVPSL